MANETPETNQANRIASSLGATIQADFVPPGRDTSTTHVVAGRQDTEKVYRASKFPAVCIVSLDWIQACSDRWERVHEHGYELKYVPPVDISSGSSAREHSNETVKKKMASTRSLQREDEDSIRKSSGTEIGCVSKDDKKSEEDQIR